MIPLLSAEESITRVNEAAIANAKMPQHEQRRILNTWRAALRRQHYEERTSKGRTLGQLMGIGTGIGLRRG